MTIWPGVVSRIRAFSGSVPGGSVVMVAFLFSQMPAALFRDRRLLDVVHIGKLRRQISVAFALDAVLRRSAAARRAFAVIGIERIDHGHAGGDLAERRKALAVERGVVGEIDEHLGGAGVG